MVHAILTTGTNYTLFGGPNCTSRYKGRHIEDIITKGCLKCSQKALTLTYYDML